GTREGPLIPRAKVDQLAKTAAAPRTYAAAAGCGGVLTRPVLAVQRQAQALRELIVEAGSVTHEVANMTSTQTVQAINGVLGIDLAKGARRLADRLGLHRWAIAFSSQEEKNAPRR